jgi:hypothetical protein
MKKCRGHKPASTRGQGHTQATINIHTHTHTCTPKLFTHSRTHSRAHSHARTHIYTPRARVHARNTGTLTPSQSNRIASRCYYCTTHAHARPRCSPRSDGNPSGATTALDRLARPPDDCRNSFGASRLPSESDRDSTHSGAVAAATPKIDEGCGTPAPGCSGSPSPSPLPIFVPLLSDGGTCVWGAGAPSSSNGAAAAADSDVGRASMYLAAAPPSPPLPPPPPDWATPVAQLLLAALCPPCRRVAALGGAPPVPVSSVSTLPTAGRRCARSLARAAAHAHLFLKLTPFVPRPRAGGSAPPPPPASAMGAARRFSTV